MGPCCSSSTISVYTTTPEEAFPNAGLRFRQAFSATDPVPPLLQLLSEHPTYFAVSDLVVEYTEAVEAGPSRGQSLASALVRLSNSSDVPTLGSETLSSLIDSELADHHFKVIYGTSEVKEYGPKNTYLLESLLSGLSLKHGLTMTNNQLVAIDNGLDAPQDSDDSEVLVVGACIQLLLNGSKMVTEAVGSYRKSAEVIASKLKAQQAGGTVNDLHAIQVLELAISHANAGFKPEDDIDNAWDLLFPSKS